MTNLSNNETLRAGNIWHWMSLLLVVAILPAWDQPADALPKPVAKVNGTVLTEADLEAALNEIMPAGVFHGGFSSKKRATYRPQARKLTHILISVKPEATAEEWKAKNARAQEVIDKINAGQDMSAVASDYSDGPYRVKGGGLGLVHRGRLYPTLEKEVFQLSS